MRDLSFLPAVLLSATASLAPAAVVNFSAGGGPDTVLFETSAGAEMVGGTLFAGTFSTPPSAGLGLSEVLANFLTFDALDTMSGSAGNFAAGSLTGNVEPTFASGKIYLVVVNTASIATATEFAVFSSTDSSWTFPANDTSATPANITLVGTVDQYFAGSADTIDTPGGIPGTFNSIQLESTAPEPIILPEITAVVVAGQPGIEFAFPTAQAGSVTFTMEESLTLLPAGWSAVAATPSVISDDGTTQVLRILHPSTVSGKPECFFRLTAVPSP